MSAETDYALPRALLTAASGCRGLTLFCCGNPSRGDDAIGPWIAAQVKQRTLPGVRVVEDFQWQIEHALDFAADKLALFVDAAVNQPQPLQISEVVTSPQFGHSSHALTPAQLLSVCDRSGLEPPAYCGQLTLAATRFELGGAPSEEILQRGEQALRLIIELAGHLKQR